MLESFLDLKSSSPWFQLTYECRLSLPFTCPVSLLVCVVPCYGFVDLMLFICECF